MVSLRDLVLVGFVAILATPLGVATLGYATAQVMGSSNYRIQQDSVNFGGGFSSSTNFAVESTFGEVGTGDAQSSTFRLRAGYQQLDTTFISLSSVPDVAMTPPIPGLSGGTANGSTTVVVTTDSPSGYQLTIAASQSPAMRSVLHTISDYTPVGVPDFVFTTAATAAHFGYSPEGVDIVNRFRDNGTACGVGSFDASLACWDGLDTIAEPIAQSTGPNVPSGAGTTVHFRVSVGATASQPSGVYVATSTLTALPI